MSQWLDPCVAMGSMELLVIWLFVGAVAFLFGPLLMKLPAKLKRAVAVSVFLFAALLGGPTSAFATIPTPEACYWMQASGMPCWMLNALWCPCGNDPPPPPPPPG
jgi:hypothetical protein